MKTGLVHHRSYATHDEARRDLFTSVEGWYDQQRLHLAPATEAQPRGNSLKYLLVCVGKYAETVFRIFMKAACNQG